MSVLSKLPSSVPTDLWLGGKQTAASNNARFAVTNPATGAELTTVADATSEDALKALRLADAAQSSWAATPARERSGILRRAFDLLHSRDEEFATVITLEMGKSLKESRSEVAYGSEFLRWFSEEAVRISGRFAHAPQAPAA